MSFKDTLNLPKTNFEMKANLNKKEPAIIEKWYEINLYELARNQNKNKKSFVLLDGPPYANGDLHVGHALNKILKDFVNKSKLMNEYFIHYVPGWDTHGLPIEQKVTESGVDRKSISPSNFRQLCQKYALEQVEIQKEQFKRFGILGDFENPYITLDKKFEEQQIDVFFQMFEKGLIYKDLKPIIWSPSSESALAMAEIEYYDKKSPSIFVKFNIIKGNDQIKENEKLVIWTTTPWTIPANMAIAVGEKIKYTKAVHNGETLIFAIECREELERVLETKFDIGEVILGKDIINIEYKHPLIDRISPVVLGHHVSTESGTGLVHIAPSHGEDDYYICKKEGIDIVNYIDNSGMIYNNAPFAPGEFWLDSNKTVTIGLKEQGSLIKMEWFDHSYPHDWRTKEPVMYKVMPQWFGSIEKIKKEIIAAIKEVNWIPKWGESRLTRMFDNRPDWCISRQRLWGVPIPIIYGEDKKPIIDSKLNKHIKALIGKFGSNIWFEKNVNDLLPKGYSHHSSPRGKFTKEQDIMDVWFDSGSVHHYARKVFNLDSAPDLILEGSDQYRGWFNSSLVTSVAIYGEAPYKNLLSHGFVLDGKGEKMSKSKGNVFDPKTIIETKGADILRLWVATSKYQSDIRISNEIINQVSEYYKGIRFKIRFALSNLYDFDITKDSTNNLSLFDKHTIMMIQKFNQQAIKNYEKFDFNSIISDTNIFLNDISANYFDFIKDTLYIAKANASERRAIQTVLHYFVDVMLKVLAPIISFTTEEAYSIFIKPNKKSSIFLESMKTKELIPFDQDTYDKVQTLIKVKNDINKEIENQKTKLHINKTAQCVVKIKLKDEFSFISKIPNINKFLIVASIEFVSNLTATKYETGVISISKTNFDVCNRCRAHKSCVKDDICLHCKNIIS